MKKENFFYVDSRDRIRINDELNTGGKLLPQCNGEKLRITRSTQKQNRLPQVEVLSKGKKSTRYIEDKYVGKLIKPFVVYCNLTVSTIYFPHFTHFHVLY